MKINPTEPVAKNKLYVHLSIQIASLRGCLQHQQKDQVKMDLENPSLGSLFNTGQSNHPNNGEYLSYFSLAYFFFFRLLDIPTG